MPGKDWNITSASHGSALAIQVKASPGKNRIQKIGSDGRLYIMLDCENHVQAINRALVRFLAEIFGVRLNQVEIVAGDASNKKLVSIMDIDSSTAQKLIMEHLQDN